jgi:hypothetical protein
MSADTKPQGKSKAKTLATWVRPTFYETVKRVARSQGRSISQIVRISVERYVQSEEANRTAA